MKRAGRSFFAIAGLMIMAAGGAGVFAWAANNRPATQNTQKAKGSSAQTPAAPITAMERKDRVADRAALSAYRAAVASLERLLKQKKGTPQEPAILMKLGDTYQKAAAIEFRVGHGVGGKDISRYHQLLERSIQPLTRMIETFPKNPDLPTAYFKRAKAYKELNRKESAVADLRYLIDHYPKTLDNVSAILTLADLLVETRDYRSALFYLNRLNVKPYDPHYTLTLEKLGWCHYYQNEIPQAISYVERILAFGKGKTNRTKAETAERDTAFSNLAMYYATGIDKKEKNYSADRAIGYFQSIESGPDLGKIVVPFAYILRSKDIDDGLEQYRTQVLQLDLPAADKMEILTVLLGHQVNKKRFVPIQQTAREMAELWDKEKVLASDTRVRNKMSKVFSEASESLLYVFTKNRGVVGGQIKVGQKESPGIAATDPLYPVAQALLEVYKTSLRIIPEEKVVKKGDVSRRQKIIYNMAEICYQIREYRAATGYYQYVVGHGSTSQAELVADASIKAVGARFEQFRADKLVAEQLAAKPIQKVERKEIKPEVEEWLNWVRRAWSDKKHKKRKQLELFVFEGNRLLYANGHLKEALENLIEFANEVPTSDYAVPSATLAIDTYLVSEDWESANKLAQNYVQVPAWKGTEFSKKMNDVLADTSFKMIEAMYKKGDYDQALAKADQYFRAHPTSKYYRDCLALAGNAALALKDKKRAMLYLVPASANGGTVEMNALTLLTGAALAEEDLDFTKAAEIYKQYLGLKLPANALSKEDRTALHKKILIYHWISGNRPMLKKLMEDNTICDRSLQVDCERLGVWMELTGPAIQAKGSKVSGWAKLAQASINEVKQENRIYWAVIALWNGQSLVLKDRTAMFEEIAKAWNKIDPIWKFDLVPYLSVALPRSLQQARERVRTAAPIKTGNDLVNLKRRVKLIEEMEKSFEKVADIPLQGIKVAAINENANAYMDFSKDLGSLRRIKGLSAEEQAAVDATLKEFREQFEKKVIELRKKAIEFSGEVVAEASLVFPIAKALTEESPKEARKVVPWRLTEQMPAFSLAVLDGADPEKGWATAAVAAVSPEEKAENERSEKAARGAKGKKGGKPQPKLIVQPVVTGKYDEKEAVQRRTAALKKEWVAALKAKNWPKVAFLQEWGAQAKPALLDEVRADMARGSALVFAGAQAEGVTLLKKGMTQLNSNERRNLLVSLVLMNYGACSKNGTKKALEELNDVGVEMENVSTAEVQVLSDAIVWSEAAVSDSLKDPVFRRAPPSAPPAPLPEEATPTATPSPEVTAAASGSPEKESEKAAEKQAEEPKEVPLEMQTEMQKEKLEGKE